MTLTTITAETARTRLRPLRAWPARLDLSLDIVILGLALAVCAAFLFQGGLEAALGAAMGAAIAGRRRGRAEMLSGAFAGLFIGAMFASFFHAALATLVATIF